MQHSSQIPFREHHLFALLNTYSAQTLPIDLFIHYYFRNHTALGSKDRAFIAETIYALIRWRQLLDFIANASSWEARYKAFMENSMDDLQQREDIPLIVRLSCPQLLFDLLTNSYGIDKAKELCLTNNHAAPTTIRVNLLKTDRETLLKRWEGLYEVSPAVYSMEGIIFHKKINFFQLPEFKQGLFEVQDEASQLVSQLVQVQPGQLVLDYCAGSGGKALAIALRMAHKGQIYLYDIRRRKLLEARQRLRRAGVQNSQIIEPDQPSLQLLKKKMDWVLVDAPCTGTGTWRRNPDMKDKFNEQMLRRILGEQRTIFEKALSFVKSEGRIVYTTCSILIEENQSQVDHFQRIYGLTIEGAPFQSFPTLNGMDGFFGVVLKKP